MKRSTILAAALLAMGRPAPGGAASFVLEWGTRGSAPGQFEAPTAIAAGPDGSIYVCDTETAASRSSPASGPT